VKLIIMMSTLWVVLSCSAVQVDREVVSASIMVKESLSNLVGGIAPGIQYVVVDKNRTVFAHQAGLANIEEGVALGSGHTMAAFSMTKTLTAIAVLQLVERNKISLDDDISDYVEHPYGLGISIRHLLSHLSGIPNPIPLNWVHLANEHENYDETKDLAKVLNAYPDLDAEPGVEYGYSNIGYWLLGKVIENVSGITYSDYVTKNIFDVLGLESNEIGFLIENESDHAKGYLKKWSLMNIFGRFFIDNELLGEYEGGWLHVKNVYLNGPSFGGVIGTASAFSKILQDLLMDQSKLIGKDSKQLLYSQQKTNTGDFISMTLGWHVAKLKGVTYFYKEGGGAGFHSEMRIYPEKGLASVIISNKTSFNSRKILTELDINYLVN